MLETMMLPHVWMMDDELVYICIEDAQVARVSKILEAMAHLVS